VQTVVTLYIGTRREIDSSARVTSPRLTTLGYSSNDARMQAAVEHLRRQNCSTNCWRTNRISGEIVRKSHLGVRSGLREEQGPNEEVTRTMRKRHRTPVQPEAARFEHGLSTCGFMQLSSGWTGQKLAR